MPCQAKCFYRESKVPGMGGCFLSLPGPMEACQGYAPPVVVGPAPLDEAMKEKFRRIDADRN